MILNQDLQTVDVVDIYDSIIWANRFDQPGDFEISTIGTREMREKYGLNNYIWTDLTNRLMIIESLEQKSDPEKGKTLKVSGRSLESILERRIVWKHTKLEGNLESQIEILFNDAIIHPTDENRKISNFKFRYSNNDYISNLEFNYSFFGRRLIDIVKAACDKYHIGYSITLEGNDFVFQFYTGKDLSTNQIMNTQVIFSEENNELININVIHSNSTFCNVALVEGEKEYEDGDKELITVEVEGENWSGINRREVYIDATSVSRSTTDEDGYENIMDEEEYQEELKSKAIESLNEQKIIHKLEGEVNFPESDYGPTKEYDIGDICEFEDENGQSEQVRVIELIYSENSNERKYYPTFRYLTEEVDVEIEDDGDDDDGGGDVIVPGS